MSIVTHEGAQILPAVGDERAQVTAHAAAQAANADHRAKHPVYRDLAGSLTLERHRTNYYDLTPGPGSAPVGPFQVRCTCGFTSGVIASADDAERLQHDHYRDVHSTMRVAA